MNCCILRKVTFRLPNTDRVTWGIVVGQREGLTLIFVHGLDQYRPHSLILAVENVKDRVFEQVSGASFPVDRELLTKTGVRLQALGDNLVEEEFLEMFEQD